MAKKHFFNGLLVVPEGNTVVVAANFTWNSQTGVAPTINGVPYTEVHLSGLYGTGWQITTVATLGSITIQYASAAAQTTAPGNFGASTGDTGLDALYNSGQSTSMNGSEFFAVTGLAPNAPYTAFWMVSHNGHVIGYDGTGSGPTGNPVGSHTNATDGGIGTQGNDALWKIVGTTDATGSIGFGLMQGTAMASGFGNNPVFTSTNTNPNGRDPIAPTGGWNISQQCSISGFMVYQATPVAEPAGLGLLGVGLLAMRRRRS